MPEDHWIDWNTETHLEQKETCSNNIVEGTIKIVLSQETMAVTTPVGLVRLKVRDEAPVM